MKTQNWIFSVRYVTAGSRDFNRRAVVGPANADTVEAALNLAGVPEDIRTEIRADATVRCFLEGSLEPEGRGYYAPRLLPTNQSWLICIGAVHAVLPCHPSQAGKLPNA